MDESGASPAITQSPIPNPQSRDPVAVAAGVITDARGRILLARRTEGRDLAGLWEFPGGKREPGESIEAALARELDEELGITVEVGAPLIRVPQRYPHKRLCLDVFRITAWQGTPKGFDGQALAWVPPHKLASYAMPPADRPVVAALQQPDRYLVTPPPRGDDDAWLCSLQAALDAGIQRVQLRDGGACEPSRWRALVARGVALCRQAGVEALVNGDAELAAGQGAGVHLRASQLPGMSKRPLPAGQLVAASCHDPEDLRHARRLACDFAVLGPLAPTPSHPGAAGIGWDGFAAMRECSDLPLYAIGGLAPADIATARAHGAQGIAAIRGLWSPASRSP